MIEFLSGVLQWWHWIVIGIIFFIVEMMTFTLVFIGFGISSILVGIIDLLFHIDIDIELFLWGLLSIISISIWYKFLKIKTISNSGQSNSMTDMKGIVIEEIKPLERGKVKFSMPLLGEREWEAISDSDIVIKKGDVVYIVKIKGQILLVSKNEIEDNR
ncbi:Putative activity regulator of membrane protease YbbK [hydrothermal vent metagenome]|uniref:Putative activity regulator of membrane protease YbbK n=1 Tax=hydrothermal vent metagenome TaxID=652676 RepID=A0A1W1EJ42_9ZZZZ